MNIENEISFPEELKQENGNYICKCGNCGRFFQGHKRRVRCKPCQNELETALKNAELKEKS